MNGAEIVAKVFIVQGIDTVFTLIGGHISPILVESKRQKIRVVDVRHEVNAVFAADAWSRLKGTPGVAIVTAGPGVTNTVTAMRNALMAQSPLVLIGGATATALRGRGALQDIDQIALMRSNVKKTFRVTRVKNIASVLSKAFAVAREGVPGPVFVELPVDLLYPENIIREWYADASPKGKGFGPKLLRTYLKFHVNQLLGGTSKVKIPKVQIIAQPPVSIRKVNKIAKAILGAKRPLILAGSQVLHKSQNAKEIAKALAKLNIPVYLSGMARGALGSQHPLQFRHKRRDALRECDLVILLGVPADFRLNYGAHINRKAFQINVNLDRNDLLKNKRPNLGIQADAGTVLLQLAEKNTSADVAAIAPWIKQLGGREAKRESEIASQAAQKMKQINPLDFFIKATPMFAKKTIFVVDGGDFVATGAYTLKPGGPLTWLDPGVFGTLGVGAGFAIGAKIARPDHDVVIIYGDGSAGYSLLEFDTFVRHKIPIGAIIGNDACWAQIYRDQVELLKDDVGCMLAPSPYEKVSQAFGGGGMTIRNPSQIKTGVNALKASLSKKKPYLLNVLISRSEFRKGSISI